MAVRGDTGLGGIESDDFNSDTLGSWWTPAFGGTASGAVVGFGTAEVAYRFTVPNDQNYNFINWDLPYIAQPATNVDLQIESGWNTFPDTANTGEFCGIMLAQTVEDDGEAIRLEARSTGVAWAVSMYVGGTKLNDDFLTEPTSYLELAIEKSGDTFIGKYRLDDAGGSWVTSHTTVGLAARTIAKAAAFAGLEGGAQAFTADLDYFWEATAPIPEEDSGGTISEHYTPPPVFTERNDLSAIEGILNNQVPVGNGPGTAILRTLPTGALKYDQSTHSFTQAAREDLTDGIPATGTANRYVGFDGNGDYSIDLPPPTTTLANLGPGTLTDFNGALTDSNVGGASSGDIPLLNDGTVIQGATTEASPAAGMRVLVQRSDNTFGFVDWSNVGGSGGGAPKHYIAVGSLSSSIPTDFLSEIDGMVLSGIAQGKYLITFSMEYQVSTAAAGSYTLLQNGGTSPQGLNLVVTTHASDETTRKKSLTMQGVAEINGGGFEIRSGRSTGTGVIQAYNRVLTLVEVSDP